jgi:xylose isomerase
MELSNSIIRPIDFHGEVVENHGDHKHYKAHELDLVGKTIERFECSAVNLWSLFFTDGTAVTVEAEVVGMYQIPSMTLCNTCWEEQ